MTEFKKGDKVLCIDDCGKFRDAKIKNGEIYTVSSFNGGWVTIEGEPFEYVSSRFNLVDPETLQEVSPKSTLEAAPLPEIDDPAGLFNKSKATTTNPKDLFGSLKVSITKFPAIALAHGAHAMMDGAVKYGPYNWRDKDVIASIYVDAAIRHLLDWFEGQEQAKDSGVHHLGHAMACCAILLDAQENGALIDDRPVFDNPDVLDKVLDRLSAIIKAKKEAV